jgi:glycerol-1-phosphate dehydrogenase [NAD(P)+]
MDLLNMEIENMAGINFHCSCGRDHSVEIHNIIIGSGVVNELSNVLKEFEGKNIFIVEDKNTYKAAGQIAEDKLSKNFKVTRLIFEDEHLIADEKALGRMIIEIPQGTDLILAVGSGTINDLCRFLSFKTGIPYVVIGTAPSMDGYASVVSPLVVNGVKTTYNAVYPQAIIADIDILRAAPMKMLHAGLGDILGKYTAIADWHLARILKGEYFCSTIEKMTMKAVEKCIEHSMGIPKRDSNAVKAVTEALILSGLAIGMCGTSRPASGEEHHLSHCWETILMNENKIPEYLHGNNVGVGVGIILEAYKYVSALDIQKIYSSGEYKHFEKDKWIENLSKAYGKITLSVAESKEDYICFDETVREENVRYIVDNWDEIKELCDLFLPSAEAVRALMKNIGAVYMPSELGLNIELFKQSFVAAKDIRKRYGILQLLEDIGKLEEAAEVIGDMYYQSHKIV